MDVDEAEIWLKQVVKGCLADPTTRKAIQVILEELDRYEEEEECAYLVTRDTGGPFNPYLKNRYKCGFLNMAMKDKSDCKHCDFKVKKDENF